MDSQLFKSARNGATQTNPAASLFFPQFDRATSFTAERASVKVDGLTGLIDRTGTFVVRPRFEEIRPFSEGLAAVWGDAKRQGDDRIQWIYGGRWGFIDRFGKTVVKPQFDWVQDFSEGLAAVGVGGRRDSQGNVATMDGAKWGFIDQQGNTVIRPQFDEVRPFSSGVAVVWSETEKKLGLIARTGNLVLPYEFTSIEPFHEGLAAVRGPRGPGYITPDGRSAIEAVGWDSPHNSRGSVSSSRVWRLSIKASPKPGSSTRLGTVGLTP